MQLSAVTGAPRVATIAVHVPAPVVLVMGAAQIMVGLILSVTITA